jgi:hypothetical protein
MPVISQDGTIIHHMQAFNMPGFKIGVINQSSMLSDSPRFYTSYTWDISEIANKASLSTGTGPFDNNAVLLLKNATLPSISFKKVEVEGSVNYKFSGSPTFEDIRISWYDSHNMGEWVKEWLELIIDRKSGAIKPASSYKSSTKLTKYLVDNGADDMDGNGGDIEPDQTDYILYGSWPVGFKESELTYTEASIKTIELTVTYDYYTMNSGYVFESPYKSPGNNVYF